VGVVEVRNKRERETASPKNECEAMMMLGFQKNLVARNPLYKAGVTEF
jgi:hypothetical protein